MFYIIWIVASYVSLIVILKYLETHSQAAWLVHETRNGVSMGESSVHTLTAKDWSTLALRVITSPKTMLLQTSNIAGSIFRLCFKMMIMTPVLIFWFTVYLFVWEPDVFNLLTLAEIKKGFGDGDLLFGLLFYAGISILGFVALFGKYSTLGLRNYIGEVFHKEVRECLGIPRESIIYLEKTKSTRKSL
ncbi:hypothetical protein AB6867_26240 [Serratia proteamaculans]|uniref:hypothetical protein n=1 Tax=Serratia proteamaculans TaxID=28151 RepID=UPI0039BDBC6D